MPGGEMPVLHYGECGPFVALRGCPFVTLACCQVVLLQRGRIVMMAKCLEAKCVFCTMVSADHLVSAPCVLNICSVCLVRYQIDWLQRS